MWTSRLAAAILFHESVAVRRLRAYSSRIIPFSRSGNSLINKYLMTIIYSFQSVSIRSVSAERKTNTSQKMK